MNPRTVKETNYFRLYRSGNHFRVRCKVPDCHPAGRRVSLSDANYLAGLSTLPHANGQSTFDAACVMDVGVGVFEH